MSEHELDAITELLDENARLRAEVGKAGAVRQAAEAGTQYLQRLEEALRA